MLPTLVIVYLRKKGDSLGPYLRDWDKSVGDRLQVFEFDELKSWDSFPSATYIFTDVETLDEAQRAWAIELWTRLESADGPIRLLNDPRRMLGRYEFLRLLHERGVNKHRAYRLNEAHRARFPVFLRRERRHWGVTRVLRSRTELVKAVVWALRKGWPVNDLLVVEFVDTVDDDGRYHKYGAYYIDGRVIPRSLLFATTGWSSPGSARLRRSEAARGRDELHRDEPARVPHQGRVLDGGHRLRAHRLRHGRRPADGLGDQHEPDADCIRGDPP